MIKNIPDIRKGMSKALMETHMEDLTNSKEANGKFSGVRAEESLQDLPGSPAYCSCSANSAVLH